MGDFVYHFNYDREALLALFQLFLEFFSQDKQLYILAGNHDRLGSSFVFEEGKQVFDLLLDQQTQGKLFFITKPLLTEIEGKDILFLPYVLDLNLDGYPELQEFRTELIDGLLQSEHKNEQLSGKVNLLVKSYLSQYPNLILIHHYYLNNTKFPGYRSSFRFKDVALDEQLLENPGLKMISGHLHAPFIYKNYFCTGSLWASSPLESNQFKGLRKRDSSNQLHFYHTQIVNYLELTAEKQLSIDFLYDFFAQLQSDFETYFASEVWKQPTFYFEKLELVKTILHLKVEQMNYEHLEDYGDPTLFQSLKDYKLKKQSKRMQDLLDDLDRPDQDALSRFGGWKELLKTFIAQQYPGEKEEYYRILSELKIL